MALPARGHKLTRRSWLFAGMGLCVCKAMAAEELVARLDGDLLYISAPRFHFLTGKPLERLKDGASVVFISQLTLSLDGNRSVLRRLPERFVVSYDLWEEKFSVTRLGGTQRSISHLSSSRAENWCLNSMAISTAGVPQDKPLWIRLDMRAADSKDETAVVGEPGINLTRLIEIFSRPPSNQQPHWVLERGPVRLADLRRAEHRRGPRTG